MKGSVISIYSKLLIAVVAMFSFSSHAVLIDFSTASGNQGTSLVLPEATINLTDGSYILAGRSAAGQNDGFCFLGNGCAADGELIFSAAVENLFFDIDGAQSGDSVLISAFDNANNLLGSITATTNGVLDFSGFGAINRLFFDDSSTAAGVGYSTFSFDWATPSTQVSEPSALALLLLSMGCFAFLRKRGN